MAASSEGEQAACWLLLSPQLEDRSVEEYWRGRHQLEGSDGGVLLRPMPRQIAGDDGRRKLLVCQQRFTNFEAIRELLREEKRLGRAASCLVFPEGWFPGRNEVSVEEGTMLRRLADISKEENVLGVWGSFREPGSPLDYVTTIATEAETGDLLGAYRKRCAVSEGSHAAGTEACCWQSRDLGKVSVLICFDVENAQPFDETVALGPRLIFNPSHIPPPSSASAGGSSAARETVSRAFETTCRDLALTIAKVDWPHPTGYGISLVIDPCSTTSAGLFNKACALPHFLPNDDYRAPIAPGRMPVFAPPERPRTERRDCTGDRVHYRFVAAHTNSAVLDFAFVRSAGGFQKNTFVASLSQRELIGFNPITCEPVFTHRSSVGSAAFTGALMLDKTRIYLTDSAGQLHSVAPASGQTSAIHQLSQQPIVALASSPLLQHYLVAGTSSGQVMSADTRCAEPVVLQFGDASASIRSCAASHGESPLLACATADAKVFIYDARSPSSPLFAYTHDTQAFALEFSPSNSFLACATEAGQVWSHSVAGGSVEDHLPLYSTDSPTTSLAWITDQHLAVGSLQHGAFLLDVSAAEKDVLNASLRLNMPIEAVTSCRFEGHNILLGSTNGRAWVVRAEQNRNHLSWSIALQTSK